MRSHPSNGLGHTPIQLNNYIHSGLTTLTYMDGAYDSRDIFRYLESKGITPVIKVRKNSVLDGSIRDKYLKQKT